MPTRVGRYELHEPIGRGGMATVFLARLVTGGISKPVAIKRLHATTAEPQVLRNMLADEARLAMRVAHPNIVAVHDVVDEGGMHLVMDLVIGETLALLLRRSEGRAPARIVAAILLDVLHGLDAAHRANDERGAPLGLVHRDVSPQNVLVGADGMARVLDFGIAKASGRLQETTRDGRVKGKLSYIAPEQLGTRAVDARADVFAAGVMLWEALVGRALFQSDTAAQTIGAVLTLEIPAPSSLAPELSPELDAVVLRALARPPDQRWPDARAFAEALEAVLVPAPAREVGAWVERLAADQLAERRAAIIAMESGTSAAGAATAELGDDDVPSEIAGHVPAMPRPPRRRWVVSLFVVLATLALVAAAAAASRKRPATAPPTRERIVIAAARSVEAPPGPAPSAEPPAPPPSGSAPRRPSPKAPKRVRPDCRNPFYIDARGIRVPRAECF